MDLRVEITEDRGDSDITLMSHALTDESRVYHVRVRPRGANEHIELHCTDAEEANMVFGMLTARHVVIDIK